MLVSNLFFLKASQTGSLGGVGGSRRGRRALDAIFASEPLAELADVDAGTRVALAVFQLGHEAVGVVDKDHEGFIGYCDAC